MGDKWLAVLSVLDTLTEAELNNLETDALLQAILNGKHLCCYIRTIVENKN